MLTNLFYYVLYTSVFYISFREHAAQYILGTGTINIYIIYEHQMPSIYKPPPPCISLSQMLKTKQ